MLFLGAVKLDLVGQSVLGPLGSRKSESLRIHSSGKPSLEWPKHLQLHRSTQLVFKVFKHGSCTVGNGKNEERTVTRTKNIL